MLSLLFLVLSLDAAGFSSHCSALVHGDSQYNSFFLVLLWQKMKISPFSSKSSLCSEQSSSDCSTARKTLLALVPTFCCYIFVCYLESAKLFIHMSHYLSTFSVSVFFTVFIITDS